MQTAANLISWKHIKLVIFDVDGTLYHQQGLRKKMLKALLSHYLVRPHKIRELEIIRQFRKEREKMAGQTVKNLEKAQYEWCAQKTNFPEEEIRKVVGKWIFQYPNPLLSQYIYCHLKEFFDYLPRQNIKIAVFSDYDAHDKLKALDLKADLVVSATDTEIDRLKPDPEGIYYILKKLHISPEQTLFIGDRDDRDGECARNAGINYLILPPRQPEFYGYLLKQVKEQLSVKP